MELIVDKNFLEDPTFRAETQPRILLRILSLLEEIRRDPFRGTGKPEPLKGLGAGVWSRRITQEHRLGYRIEGGRVFLLGASLNEGACTRTRMTHSPGILPEGELILARRFNAGKPRKDISPEGTAEIAAHFRARSTFPSGRDFVYRSIPGVETPGYCQRSLRESARSSCSVWECPH